MLSAPGMIGATVGAGLKRAIEVGKRERCDLLRQPQLDRRIVKCGHRRIELRKQSGLRRQLVAVRVESAERTEEYLPQQTKRRARLHDLRYLLQLGANRCRRENG